MALGFGERDHRVQVSRKTPLVIGAGAEPGPGAEERQVAGQVAAAASIAGCSRICNVHEDVWRIFKGRVKKMFNDIKRRSTILKDVQRIFQECSRKFLRCFHDAPVCSHDAPGCSQDAPGCLQDAPGCFQNVQGFFRDVSRLLQDVSRMLQDALLREVRR